MIFERIDGGFRLTIDDHSREVIVHLFSELRHEVEAVKQHSHSSLAPHMKRLFPAAYHDDEQRNEEYRRLTHGDLADSHLAAIDDAVALLAKDRVFAIGDLERFVRAINAMRLVLGTLLDVSENEHDDDDPTEDADAGDDPTVMQRQVYDYLGWLLHSSLDELHT